MNNKVELSAELKEDLKELCLKHNLKMTNIRGGLICTSELVEAYNYVSIAFIFKESKV